MTTTPAIITVAITGSVPRKKDNSAVPISASEQVESTHEAFEAGASLVHIHVRDEAENSSSDPKRFAEVQDGIRRHCPGMIIQFSTGGRGRDQEARGVRALPGAGAASPAPGTGPAHGSGSAAVPGDHQRRRDRPCGGAAPPGERAGT